MSYLKLYGVRLISFLTLLASLLTCFTGGEVTSEGTSQQIRRKEGVVEVSYLFTFPNRIRHEAEVTAIFSNLPERPFKLYMSRSSPGRYSLHQFAKNLYNLKAFDVNGQEIKISRINSNIWEVARHNGYIKVIYTLFGDHLNGTYSSIRENYIMLNMPASLLWGGGLEEIQYRIKIESPEQSWKIYTQLPAGKSSGLYYAPDLHYLMDSPIMLGNFTEHRWYSGDRSDMTEFILIVNHKGGKAEVESYREFLQKIVDESRAVFGEFPSFDYGSYLFMVHSLPHARHDGMEHRNSTVITHYNRLAYDRLGFLLLSTHELFHAWNVERLRPESLTPFNLKDINVSEELWFVEGATSYYDDLILMRSGYYNLNSYLLKVNNSLNLVSNSPYRRFQSVAEISLGGALLDGAVFPDRDNSKNIYLTYYRVGEMLSLALDLSLRAEFKGLSLDDYMQLLWKKYGKKEIAYNNRELELTLAELTGDGDFAADFFNSYVYGRELPDYTKLFSHFGVLVKKRFPKAAYLGHVYLKAYYGTTLLTSDPLAGTPLYEAGLTRGDAIITLGGFRVRGVKEYYWVLGRLKPGQEIKITYRRDGKVKTTSLKVEANPTLDVRLYEHTGLNVTEEMKKFRKEWLGSKIKKAP